MSVLTPTLEAPARPRSPSGRSHALPLAVLGSAALVWAFALAAVDLDGLSDIGLVSALPVGYFVAIGLLTIGFFSVLSGAERPAWLLGAYLLAAVLFLHGVPGFVEGAVRFPTAWVHAGFTEHIMTNHGTLPNLDARFSWPGFFSAFALVAEAGGVSPLWFARWAPVVVNGACLLPLAAILNASGADSRVRWLALWLFVVANWVGQDYFAPQALAFFLYLVFAAVLLHRRRPSPPLVALLLAMGATVIVSHQLTPFAMAAAAVAVVVARRSALWVLPVALAVGAVAWISFGAEVYWRGHLADVTGGLGRLGSSLGAGLDQRLTGSPGHLTVVRLRMVTALAMWLLAGYGGLRAWRRTGRAPWVFLLLAGAPLGLAGLQSYGGEIMLRVYLFSLPFVALLAALAFTPLTGRRLLAAGAASMASVLLLVTIRYGNERFESFTKDEVAAVRWVMEQARTGDRIVAVNPSLPWRDRDIGAYKFIGQIEEEWMEDGKAVAGYLTPAPTGYLILTRSQAAHGEVVEGRPAGWLDALEERTVATGLVQVAYRNDDAVVLRSRR